MAKEIWKQVKSLPKSLAKAYQVSDRGRVRTRLPPWSRDGALSDKWRIVEPRMVGAGYPIISVKRKQYYVRRLVLETFVGPCPPSGFARHKRGSIKDNRLQFLYWAKRGQEKHSSKLTYKDVRAIRKSAKLKNGPTQQQLAAMFKVSEPTISNIISKTTWRPPGRNA